LEEFLDELDTSHSTPTLDEVLNLKPTGLVNPVGPGSRNYAEEYEVAVKKVLRAFSSQQIRGFLNILKFNDRLPTTRRGMVQILLQRAWDWPSPHELQDKAGSEKERITRGECYPFMFLEIDTEVLSSYTSFSGQSFPPHR
jgi:hypothetical protein